ncbi:NO-inducible flavohemoprotein [Bordetella avium]|uniref:Flavohemoprotein n=1 Tax=Bordetella avium (strain 197N) TaxID=360910 RepID=Q2KZS6_BORA1|nr:NO-inducible flavohemoprotein [Bordetella avium]AZY49356.1 NO-inducible flavohemoprotein [Bordetella avium]AZY52710.1 NO-inducible flavohemoprotein [Bordetella avium]RIQ12834.1 NO-inducible flavohemoprotein [Bordetella avium]RIQ19130.1 NO-inducible flavohemoprotein [Bordetella avium]RIQ32041.1 NO-inducible flavohemoprotein [Bordetella avium]
MLSASVRELVKSSAPVLKTQGEALTRHFYTRMLSGNPELKQVFNLGHQHNGQQQQALALAVAAYAEHIDDPSVLAPVLERVAHKHVSLGIRPEHYAIVGRHLLASIREVLGEAASDALIEAWAAAYGQLADVLIGMESARYAASAAQPGGWTGWRGFKVVGKVVESAEITSFYLRPADGGPLPSFLPGQYLSVRLYLPELGLMQPRQYSLSDAPGKDSLRISVKREAGGAGPAGQVSTHLHDHIEEGDVLDVAPPQGEFVLDTKATTPVVLISGGVGITPMMAMLNTVLGCQTAGEPARELRFVHACREKAVHAMRDAVNVAVARYANVRRHVFYERVAASDRPGVDYDYEGRIDWRRIAADVILPDADYYLCGPLPFMREQFDALSALGVPAGRIHAEAFGTGGPGC